MVKILVACCLSWAMQPAPAQPIQERQFEITKGSPVAVHLEPSTASAVVRTIPAGTRVTASEVRRGWYRVRLPLEPTDRAPVYGWLPAEVMSAVPAGAPQPGPPVAAANPDPPPAPPVRPAARRVEVSANVGAQTGGSKFSVSSTRPSNGGETETITADHGVNTALGFSVGAAVRLVPQFWAGVHFAMTEMKPGASVTAVIPHPILFNASRTVDGSIDNVVHHEQNVHVELMYALPVHAVDVKVMAGPTFFNLKQDFVSAVTINQSYPFDSATFASAATKRLSQSAVGFNTGVDISRSLSSSVGIGALIRYSRGDVKFDDTDIGRQTIRAGGLEAAGGVRVRF